MKSTKEQDCETILINLGFIQCNKCHLYYKKGTEHQCRSDARYERALESHYVDDLEGW
ncbi:hypothetical protein [Candidatus Lokiarchaeum ossiferum]|uniref:hypothetical protein n=1 Tax=Candidatus Lokiarchaeum ossiferum TaxID=2951803 RepID=UPI00352F855F